jgi:hypothetical protein
MQMGPLNGGMLGFQGGPNMMQMNMPPQMMPSRMMSGPPMQQMNRPPPNFPPGVSNINTAQTMNTLLQNRQTVAQPIIPPGTHVNPHVYPYLGTFQIIKTLII